jgi:hypothetical protein
MRRATIAVALAMVLALCGCADDGSWFHPGAPKATLTASGTCPAELGRARDVSYPSGGPMGMVLDGPPRSAQVCFYERGRGAPGTRVLSRSVRLVGARAIAVAHSARAVRLAGPPAGRTMCPPDTGAIALIVLGYRRPGGARYERTLWWKDSGCEELDNGRIGAWRAGNPSFAQFDATMAGVTMAR